MGKLKNIVLTILFSLIGYISYAQTNITDTTLVYNYNTYYRYGKMTNEPNNTFRIYVGIKETFNEQYMVWYNAKQLNGNWTYEDKFEKATVKYIAVTEHFGTELIVYIDSIQVLKITTVPTYEWVNDVYVKVADNTIVDLTKYIKK